jgi:hypothetical protein
MHAKHHLSALAAVIALIVLTTVPALAQISPPRTID